MDALSGYEKPIFAGVAVWYLTGGQNMLLPLGAAAATWYFTSSSGAVASPAGAIFGSQSQNAVGTTAPGTTTAVGGAAAGCKLAVPMQR
jgi:hypothetical protein